jgi:hypothetical protein
MFDINLRSGDVVLKETCYKCAYFKLYYVKRDCDFIETNVGYCSNIKNDVISENVCDFWKRKQKSYFTLNSKLVIKKIYRGLSDIAELTQILEQRKKDGEI